MSSAVLAERLTRDDDDALVDDGVDPPLGNARHRVEGPLWRRRLQPHVGKSIEENVAAAITIFNRAVETFNTTLRSVPWNVVNGAFNRLDAYDPFRDTAGEADIEYTFRANP